MAGDDKNIIKTSNNEYKIIKELGSGGQGLVHLVRRIKHKNHKEGKSGPLMACKVERRSRSAEARILGEVLPQGHKRLPMFFEAETKPGYSRIFLEYCNAGDLHDLISWHWRHKLKLPEGFIWTVFCHLAEALAWIHWGEPQNLRNPGPWKAIIHRDIKPANVFLTWPRGHGTYPNVVLGDFGLAAVTTDRDFRYSNYCGTFDWQPPEAPCATRMGDVWALGSILHACCHGSPPVAKKPSNFHGSYSDWCQYPQSKQPLSIRSWYSERLEYWMTQCLKKDPEERVSSFDLATQMVPGDGLAMRRSMQKELARGSIPPP
ncbi:hypothetical protein MMC30_001422 [Trapelia coarctata]|nr:hypothetical protein [Trapelia coarctata]